MANPQQQQQQQQAKTADFKGTAKTAANETSNVVESWLTQGKANFDKFSQTYASGGREHVEALSKSGNVFAKGFEDIIKTYTNLAQSAAERNAQALKSLLGARNLSEVAETQSRLVQENIDGFLGGVTTLSELAVRVTTEALEPINAQISNAVRKAGDVAAA